ncbi:hypothetical protein [Cypionkella sp.]|uniref:hypothetical protein n=1 Tax=Cypionkella sp. TaxID=2811411 RepID=UPI00272F3636|nr:hypothetical protein [Cypionkella sp.]
MDPNMTAIPAASKAAPPISPSVAAGVEQLTNHSVATAFHAVHHDRFALVLRLGHTADEANKSAADQSLNGSSTLVVVSNRGTKQTARRSRAHGILIKLMLTPRQILAGLKIGLERCVWGPVKDRLVAGTNIGAGRQDDHGAKY